MPITLTFRRALAGLNPLYQTRRFAQAAGELRGYVESRTVELKPLSLIEPLKDMGYAPREINAIRQINSVFSHGNQLHALIAGITRHLLKIGNMAGSGEADIFNGIHAPEDITVPLVLLEYHHADEPTRDVYHDSRATLKLPFVNTDYRVFARWPSYLALAWNDLREKVGTPLYEDIARACHERATELVALELPNPGNLSAKK